MRKYIYFGLSMPEKRTSNATAPFSSWMCFYHNFFFLVFIQLCPVYDMDKSQNDI